MAKEKLLPLLKVILLTICMAILPASQTYAIEEHFSNYLAKEAKEMTHRYLIDKLNEGTVYGEDLSYGQESENDGKQYELKVFVSNSMTQELLKAYAKEAKNYGGVLIFKGLPEGSFKYLSSLVMSLGNEEDLPAMQIDQEAFEFYGVNSVPTIVLEERQDCYFEQSCRRVFDKITGNIGIRVALEKFKDSGDLQHLAEELLN